jgi:hypothetical protein
MGNYPLVERSELAGEGLDGLLGHDAAEEGGDAHQAALRGEGQLLEQLLVDRDLVVGLLFVELLGEPDERDRVLLVPRSRQPNRTKNIFSPYCYFSSYYVSISQFLTIT